jgi:quercetin dioxygenase-like cupin family protein
MRVLDARQAAKDAKSANPSRPATAVLLDSPDARLIVFRILPGQAVPPHHSPSSVLLTVLEGKGILIGPNGVHACTTGDMVAYEPNEIHGMRATDTEMHILAVITPRPGERAAAGPTPIGVR